MPSSLLLCFGGAAGPVSGVFTIPLEGDQGCTPVASSPLDDLRTYDPPRAPRCLRFGLGDSWTAPCGVAIPPGRRRCPMDGTKAQQGTLMDTTFGLLLAHDTN